MSTNQKRLADLYFEVERLVAEGAWDKAAYMRLLPEVDKAAGGDPNRMSFLFEVAEREWLEDESFPIIPRERVPA